MEVPKLHVLVPKLAFLGNFIIVPKHISARNLENTLKLLKNDIWRTKSMVFDKDAFKKNKKRGALSLDFSRSSRAWAGPIWAIMGPCGPEKSRKIH